MDILIMATKHAQYDTASHISAIKRGERFETYGNLWGTPVLFGTGRSWGGARRQLEYDRAFRTIDYVLYSYATPIAWHTVEDGWRFDNARYSASTDKAQAQAREVISSLIRYIIEPEPVTVLNYRHDLTDTQLQVLFDATVQELKPPTGQKHRTYGVLLREGYIINGPFNSYRATEIGRAVASGDAVIDTHFPYGALSATEPAPVPA